MAGKLPTGNWQPTLVPDRHHPPRSQRKKPKQRGYTHYSAYRACVKRSDLIRIQPHGRSVESPNQTAHAAHHPQPLSGARFALHPQVLQAQETYLTTEPHRRCHRQQHTSLTGAGQPLAPQGIRKRDSRLGTDAALTPGYGTAGWLTTGGQRSKALLKLLLTSIIPSQAR